MKTSIDTIAAFTAASIWADGVYDEAEKIAVEEVAESLELDLVQFQDSVEQQLSKIQKLDEDDVCEYLRNAANDVDDEEIGIIFEAAMQILITDNKLSCSEVDNLLFIAEVLGIEDSMAVMLLADLVRSEPELELSFEDQPLPTKKFQRQIVDKQLG